MRAFVRAEHPKMVSQSYKNRPPDKWFSCFLISEIELELAENVISV